MRLTQLPDELLSHVLSIAACEQGVVNHLLYGSILATCKTLAACLQSMPFWTGITFCMVQKNGYFLVRPSATQQDCLESRVYKCKQQQSVP